MLKLLFSNKNMGILGVILIAPYNAGLHLNLESYFFILYHKKRYNRQRNCSGKGDQKEREGFLLGLGHYGTFRPATQKTVIKKKKKAMYKEQLY